MTWPVALLLAFVTLFALAYVGAISAMLGLKIYDALSSLLSRSWRLT